MKNNNTLSENAFKLDGKMPLNQAIPLGLQHVLAMFVGNLTPLLIITGACGIASGEFAALQLTLLQNLPGSYMWSAPIPEELLEEWGVVQHYCDRNTNRYSEALVYNPTYIMSETEKNLLEMIRKDYPNADIQIVENGALCTYYAEENGLIVCFES